jgi:hypothetical protein
MVNFASAGFAQRILKNGLSDLSTFSLQFHVLSTNSKAASDFERCNGSIHNKMTHASARLIACLECGGLANSS